MSKGHVQFHTCPHRDLGREAQNEWTNNYVVLSNELFANLRNDNREGTRFILGHEIAHIQLHRVALSGHACRRSSAPTSCRRSFTPARVM